MTNIRAAWRSATSMTWLALMVRLGGFAALLPMALASMGDAEISAWLLFSAVASLQTIFDFGFSPTFSREIAYGFAGRSMVSAPSTQSGEVGKGSPDWSIVSTATNAMAWLYGRIAVAALLLMATLGTLATWYPIGRVSEPAHAWLAWMAVVLATSISIRGNAYTAFLIGTNRIALQKRWEALVSAVSFTAQSVMLITGFGLLGLVLAAQLGLIFQVLVNQALARRVAAGRLRRAPDHDKSRKTLIRAMWPSTWRTAAGSAMSFGVSQGMVVAAANLFTAGEAAGVQVALRIMQVTSQISQAPFYSRIPEFNSAQAASNSTHLTSNAAGAMRTSLWIFVAGVLFIDISIRPLLELIGSEMQFPADPFWIILATAVFFERFGGMHVQLLLTKNRAIQHLANGIAAAVLVAGFILLLPGYGTLALPISMLIAYAGFFAVISAFLSHLESPGRFWSFERGASLAPFSAIVAYALVLWISTD